MTGNSPSSIGLCPIYFNEFNKLQKTTGNLQASLLYTKIKFHEINSKIQKNGKTCIARSREQIASWFGFSKKKTDRTLALLEEKDLIQKKVSTWYGKKRLFISTLGKNKEVPVNIKLLEYLLEKTGSLNAVLIFSKIAFTFANTKIIHEGIPWCCISKKDLSKWSSLSERTLDTILNDLKKKGLLLKKNFSWKGRVQTHFHIPSFVIETLATDSDPQAKADNRKKSEVTHSQNCRSQPAKMTLSIKIRSNTKENNNTKMAIPKIGEKGDINFNQIHNNLTRRQESFLKAALSRTIERKNLLISCPKDLWEELKFWIMNKDQHKGITCFKHAVSRAMKIIGDKNWKTPLGFYKHSSQGTMIKQREDTVEKRWLHEKEHMKREAPYIQKSLCETSIKLGDIFSPSRNLCHLTTRAIDYAKQLSWVLGKARKGEGNFSAASLGGLVDNLIGKIESLIREGADRQAVLGVTSCLGKNL